MELDKIKEIARIIHISALSQITVESIEDSVHDKFYKEKVAKKGQIFINVLDKKLNSMLGEDASAEQVLNYTKILEDNFEQISKSIESELIKIITEEKFK